MPPLVRSVIDYVLPPRCPGCSDVVEADHRFCAKCWSALDFLTGGGCARCSIPLVATDGSLCGPCLAHLPDYDGVLAAVAYGDIARRVVLKLKYARRAGVARTIAAAIAPRLSLDKDSLLIPVPLHRWRLWSRGFNQSQAIGVALARYHCVHCDPDMLIRTRPTPPLRGMNPTERRRAVRGVFRTRRKLHGEAIYLIDDVFTTGATADACARVLKRAGAGRVTLVCWARVIRQD